MDSLMDDAILTSILIASGVFQTALDGPQQFGAISGNTGRNHVWIQTRRQHAQNASRAISTWTSTFTFRSNLIKASDDLSS